MRAIVGSLLVIAILFSYLPLFPMDGCSEGSHMGVTKMDCGSLFHCPGMVDEIFLETSALPLTGCLVPIKLTLAVDELPNSIFRPPKYSTPNACLGKKEQLVVERVGWHTRFATLSI